MPPQGEQASDTDDNGNVTARALSLLLRLEWSGTRLSRDVCPYCYADREDDMHAEDCELADVIADLWERA